MSPHLQKHTLEISWKQSWLKIFFKDVVWKNEFFKDDLDWNVKCPMKAIQKILVEFPADSSV